MDSQKLNSNKAFLADLKNERAQTADELARLDLIIEAMEARIRNMEGGNATPTAEILPTDDDTQSQDTQTRAGAYAGMTIHEAAQKFLGKVKTPQTIRQIWSALVEDGQSDIKYNAVYTALWRRVSPQGNFVKIGDSYWGVVGIAYKPLDIDSIQKNAASQGGRRAKPSQLDLCESILHDGGRPQHINELIAKLAHFGRNTNVHSLSSTLRQDTRNRFQNLGKNIWVLTRWPESLKKRENKEAQLPL